MSMFVHVLAVRLANQSMAAGDAKHFSATLDGSAVTVTWSSSTGSIDANGVFTAPVQAGGAPLIGVTATATLPDGAQALTLVTVNPPY